MPMIRRSGRPRTRCREIAAGTDPVAAVELLTRALYFRSLLTRQPIDDDVTGHFIDVLFTGPTRPDIVRR
jgi:hypothetical protein